VVTNNNNKFYLYPATVVTNRLRVLTGRDHVVVKFIERQTVSTRILINFQRWPMTAYIPLRGSL
jgi:hypothetical protein